MAGEVTATTSTLAGLMERAQYRANARFRYMSRTLEAVAGFPVQSASVGQMPSFPVPSAVSAATEANALSASAVTIGAVTLTLAAYAFETRISRLSLDGGMNISDWVIDVCMNNVIAGFDKAVCAQLDDFTTAVTSLNTYVEWCTTVSTLQESGYQGEMNAIMSFTMLNTIMADAAGKFTLQKNDEFSSLGYVGTLAGVNIFTVPDSLLATHKGGVFFRDYGIGAGYRQFANGSLVEVRTGPRDTISDFFGCAVYAAAAEISATGGLEIVVS